MFFEFLKELLGEKKPSDPLSDLEKISFSAPLSEVLGQLTAAKESCGSDPKRWRRLAHMLSRIVCRFPLKEKDWAIAISQKYYARASLFEERRQGQKKVQKRR